MAFCCPIILWWKFDDDLSLGSCSLFRYGIGGSTASEPTFYMAKTRETPWIYVYDFGLLAFAVFGGL